MKKELFISVFAIFGILTSYAQNSGDIELGVGMGLNLANVSTIDGQNDASSRTSFNVGISGEYYFSDRWGLKAKLIYDNKGWSDGFITDENFNTVTTDFKLNYVTLPIMANWHFGSNRNWYLNFGPYVGFLVNAEDSELGLDLKDGFKSTDFGFAFLTVISMTRDFFWFWACRFYVVFIWRGYYDRPWGALPSVGCAIQV